MTADKLKRQLIATLTRLRPSQDLNVVDANNLEEIEMPVLAVGVPTMEPHNVALVGVHRVGIEITLRAQSGDDQTREEIEAWCDTIETALNDPSLMKAQFSGSQSGIRLDHWEYEGCTPDWKNTTLECTFAANGLIQRLQ
jgi:hypothetical protein